LIIGLIYIYPSHDASHDYLCLALTDRMISLNFGHLAKVFSAKMDGFKDQEKLIKASE